MPYSIEKRGTRFAVIKEVPGESRVTVDTFGTEDEAKKQVASLVAKEGGGKPGAGKMAPPFGKGGYGK